MDKRVPEVRFKGFTDDWEQQPLKSVLKVNSGKDYKHLQHGNIPVYGTGGYMLSVNDKLSTKDSIGLGRKGTINKPQFLKAPFWTVDTLFFLTPFNNYDIQYIYAIIQKINWLKMNEASGVPSLSKTTIEETYQYFSIYDEQEKIGKLLKLINTEVLLQKQKLSLYRRLKKSFLQGFFPKSNEKSSRIKSTYLHTKWIQYKLADITTERNERSDIGELLSVTINNGICRAKQLNRKDNSSSNKSNYKVVHINDIAYNSMRMWQGASGVSKYNGIVSPAYTVITVKENMLDSEFLGYVLKLPQMTWIFRTHSQGLTSDTWNLKYPLFSQISIRIPNLDTQRSIVRKLKIVDDRILNQERIIKITENMKLYLLQKLFI